MKNEGQEQTKAIAEIKKEVQLSQWQRQIEERQVAGLDVAQWCERQGISKTTYYYRLRKVREHLCQLANTTVTEAVGAQEEFESFQFTRKTKRLRVGLRSSTEN